MKTAINPAAIYSLKEAAALLPLTVQTLQRYARAGIIKAKGKPYRVLGSELLKLA
jgi:predicted site-specific integrase-resolvase